MGRNLQMAAFLLLGGSAVGAAPPITGRGVILPEAEILLAARPGGLVTSVPLVEGDAAGPGDAVVILDDADEAAGVAQAKVELEKAELKLKAQKDRPLPEDVERAVAENDEAKAGLLLAEKTLSSDLKLAEGGFLSELSRQRSERFLESERARAEKKRIELEILRRGARPEELRAAELEVEARRTTLAAAQRMQARRRVSSTREGRALVSRVWAGPGQWVESGHTVAQLVYIDRLRVEIDLPGTAALSLPRGTKATLRSPSFPGVVLEGTVDRVSPVVDAGSGTVRVVVSAPNPGHRVRPGVEAEVEITP
jgi:multidrug efflux pump subunit AcrA (membrane-fusion protein)